MSRLIIVSNRLPVNIIEENDEIVVQSSIGGLATGMKAYHKTNDSLWIGSPGFNTEDQKKKQQIKRLLVKEHCFPVFVPQKIYNDYYFGFSNRTIWPLFHYFTEYTEFNDEFWQAYIDVNKRFCEAVIKQAEIGDTIWIHDYQLMLLPQMIRNKRPDLRIGFYLHIPFPSFEVFRVLPWRDKLIEGLLGADLLGFHTYDYARYFLSTVRRLFGYEQDFNRISIGIRSVYADVFPMGIDYDAYYERALKMQSKPVQDRSKEHQDLDRFLLAVPDRKLILSIDRLDYTKGIPSRLRAYEYFLQNHPEYREKVSLLMLAVPSRSEVAQYQSLRSEVDELVGRINGEFRTINWNPVIYFYRSLPFDNLIELYCSADIALLTPLRDGMNLVAKEFVATQVHQNGVLILSEMAGASKELGEALIVNPNNIEQVSQAIFEALEMPQEKQAQAMFSMQKRLKRYNVHRWADDFLSSLSSYCDRQINFTSKSLSESVFEKIKTKFSSATNRIFFLDYDGTLVGFKKKPQDAVPDRELYDLLDSLHAIPNSELVIISGRDNVSLESWFGNKPYTLIAEHGAWKRIPGEAWQPRVISGEEWKTSLRPVVEAFVDRTPGSLIEEKTYSLVWHYRNSDPELGAIRALDLKENISGLIMNNNLEILEGNKVLEIKVAGINKGVAALEHLSRNNPDFVLAIGDDWTDEYMFKSLPEQTISIKVGHENTQAQYFLESQTDVRAFLKRFI